jgi:hypothetical protein
MGGISFSGSDPMSQCLTGIAIVILLYVILGTLGFVYTSFMGMWKDRVELFPDTYASGTNMYTAIQNPSSPQALTIYPSDNQGSGIEFSYSMFINLSSSTFANGDASLYHILHKGYSQPYPLLGPGVFAWGNKNTIRIFMNSYSTWDNWTDIDNIPVDKWFHLTVCCKGNGAQGSALYVYLNGNLKTKVGLSGGTPPYQNYGNVYAFSGRKQILNTANTASLNQDPAFVTDTSLTTMTFNGSATGMISRVYYFSYALTYSEIQALMNKGPSSVMASTSLGMVPYLTDTWWTNDGTRMT